MMRCKVLRGQLLLFLVSISAAWGESGGLDPTLYELELESQPPARDRVEPLESVTGVQEYSNRIEPEVSVREHPNRTVEEYRVNNNLYMMKVTPKHGVPYYLVDDDGSGDMEMRRNSAGMDTRVPQWSLFSW